MDILVNNCIMIPGDGTSLYRNGVLGVRDGLIRIAADQQPDPLPEGPLVDAAGGYLLPGIINMHTHGCCTGPLFSSGAPGVSLAEAVAHVQRHLSQGETTLCDMSGLGTAADVEQVRAAVPITVVLGTCHFSETFTAARLVDGAGIESRHEQVTARQLLSQGDAIAIGEVGSGATLGGGVASYRYIPEAIRQTTGVTIGWAEADRLKGSVLTEESEKKGELTAVLGELGLTGRITPEQVRELVIRYARRPISAALAGFEPAAALSAKTGVPAVFHTCRESVEKLVEIAKQYAGTPARLVAGHANHTSMNEEECVQWAGELHNLGVAIDVATVQAFSGMPAILANARALLSAGLVDLISTDYGGGRWDSVLTLVDHAVQQGLLSLPAAVAMATSTPAAWFPRIGADRGVLAPGYRGDFIITAPGSITDIRHVYCAGKLVWSKVQ